MRFFHCRSVGLAFVWPWLCSTTCSAASSMRGSIVQAPDQQEIWGRLLSRLLEKSQARQSSNRGNVIRRTLQTAPACDEILATLTYLEVREFIQTALGDSLSPEEQFLLELFILPSIDYGVQVRKICGRCSDYELEPGVPLCPPQDYAATALHSGLLMLPLQRTTSTIPPPLKTGTSVVNFVCHGTQSATTDVPSTQWSLENPDAQVSIGLLFSALSGTFTIMPDYTGYGESAGDVWYRAYLVRQAYATATLPLLKRAEEIVAAESDCAAALADAVVVTGYSEGGYSSVVVADSLYRILGKEIISVQSGAGPYRLSSEQITFTFNQVSAGTFETNRRYYLALLGSAFSSTSTDPANFGENQDLLAATRRTEILDVVHSGFGRSEINAAIPTDDPLSILNPVAIQAIQAALDRGETDPCTTSAVVGETDLLCQALQDQDLVEVLENTPYPVTLCHSPDDTLVSFGNLPNLSSNPLLSFEETSGGHTSAAINCFLASIVFFLDDSNVENYPVTDKTSPNGCPVTPTASPQAPLSEIPTSSPISPTNIPTVSPSAPSTMVPSGSPSDTSSLPTSPMPTAVPSSTRVPTLPPSDQPSNTFTPSPLSETRLPTVVSSLTSDASSPRIGYILHWEVALVSLCLVAFSS